MIDYTDGRDTALNTIRKLHRTGGTRPKSLRKRAAADVDIAAVNDMLLTTEERELRSNATATVQVIKALHGNRSHPFTVATIGEGALIVERDNRPSVKAIRKAHRVQPRPFMPRANMVIDECDLEKITKHSYIISGGIVRKVLTTAKPRTNDRNVTDNYNRGPTESANGQWNNVHANTGATNDWHDQITPTTKPTRITFHQFGTPGRSSREDVIEAIKQDLTKPKRIGASPNVNDSFSRKR